MTRTDVKNLYFDWLYNTVIDESHVFRELLMILNSIDFCYTIPMDANRYEDGIELRYRFGRECGFDDRIIATSIDDHPCSVLEMMVALAVKCEDRFMWGSEDDDQTGRWFFKMLENLGLSYQTDGHLDEDFVRDRIDFMLNRSYDRFGHGGLFTISTNAKDMRSLDIWYQMCAYLQEIA